MTSEQYLAKRMGMEWYAQCFKHLRTTDQEMIKHLIRWAFEDGQLDQKMVDAERSFAEAMK